jgi:hypothetical protein
LVESTSKSKVCSLDLAKQLKAEIPAVTKKRCHRRNRDRDLSYLLLSITTLAIWLSVSGCITRMRNNNLVLHVGSKKLISPTQSVEYW